MLRNIGGQHLAVESLMGPGVDPHLYRAVPTDVRKLNSADVVFYSGLHLEGRLADPLQTLARRKPVYAVTAGIERLHQQGDKLLREVPGSQGHEIVRRMPHSLLWGASLSPAALVSAAGCSRMGLWKRFPRACWMKS